MEEAKDRGPVLRTEATVLARTEGAVRIITLNRPDKLNAANLDMQQSLLAALRETAAMADIRVLVLTGAGRAFSAGGDRELVDKKVAGDLDKDEDLAAALATVHVDTITAMLGLSIPAIAAVNGLAVGYSAGLVALCDMVVMAEDAYLCDPHVRFGVAATTATQLMWPRLTSYAFAKEMLMSGRKVHAEEALRVGLANRLSAPGEALDVALMMAADFTGLPTSGVATTKRLFNRPLLEEAARLMSVEDVVG